MKKYLILILVLAFLLIGCSNVPNNGNTAGGLTNSKNSENITENNSEEIVEQDNPENNVEDNNIENNTVEAKEEIPKENGIISVDRSIIPSNKPEMSLEDIIIKMKGILDIKDYDEISTSEYEMYDGLKTYDIDYFNTDNENSAHLSTDAYGNLISFNQYVQNNSDEGEEVNRSSAEEKVREVLEDLYGSEGKGFKINTRPEYNSFKNEEYYFEVIRTHDGIEIPTDTMGFYVNKKDLSNINIYINTNTNYDFSDTSYFADVSKVKDEDIAYEKFKEVNKLYKGYLGVVDDSKTSMFRELKYLPVYGLGNLYSSQIPIDGVKLEPNYFVTGEVGSIGSGTADEKIEMELDNGGLSPTEKEHLEDLKTQHTVEEAEKKARELFNLDNSYELNHTSFGNYNNQKGIYIWNLYFNKEDNEDINVSLLAENLNLVNYNRYSFDNNSTENYEENGIEKAITTANDFLLDKGGLNSEDFVIDVRSKNPQSGSTHTINYMRKFDDDLVVYSDVIRIEVSKSLDEVTYFNLDWDYNFEEPKNVEFNYSEEDSYEKLKDSFDFELMYIRDRYDEKNPVKLFYKLSTKDVSPNFKFIINGETGKPIDPQGREISFKTCISYSDLDQAKKPEIINKMTENGVGFYSSDLRPTEKIRQVDLLRLMYDIKDGSDKEVYEKIEGMYGNDVLKLIDKNPDSFVSHRDFSKLISKYQGDYSDIAKKNKIFKDRFKDIDSSDKDYGYLVLAESNGYITPETGKLQPDKNIDRETALYYLYNFLNKR